ncbi:hypothetical protein AOC36_10270 [Erysipelothrix larvae]|uniref:Transcription antiterminator BglG n=1 Tax=Erysipelothrix larvae TaxID=1514105 RepID=A0A0X8H1H4_9FIRM|nr:BglG family transcription antiterminator [Erysipelothrix larvae]AMC94343.1 hypothetical protein AOC36_10270 [Erysipelothrix larvae]
MDKELISLIKLIIERSYSTLSDAENEFTATRRQITYRLSKVNNILEIEGLPRITVDANRAFVLPKSTKTYLLSVIHEQQASERYIFSRKERRDYIYLMLFINQEYVKLNYIMDSLKVSRSTVLADVKDLMFELEGTGITLHNNRDRGYYLSGSEMVIRRFMMKLVIMSLATEQHATFFDTFIEDFQLDTSLYSSLVIKELAEAYDISFVEDRLKEFIYISIFLRARIINANPLDSELQELIDTDMMKTFKEYNFTKDLTQQYKSMERISDQELYYMTAWILGISVGNVEDDCADCIIISEIVGKMMNRFEYVSGVRYKGTEEIFRQLYSHFRPAYYRLLFKLPIYNPLCSRVKEEYSEFYALVKETMRPFNDLFGEEIPEDEIAYLAIHFASIYSRNTVSGKLNKLNALIVCSNGIGSSALLYNELKNMFQELNFYPPIEISSVRNFYKPINIIFSTQILPELYDKNVPVIKVSPLMDVRERYDVIREVYMRLDISGISQPNVDHIMNIINRHSDVSDQEALKSELTVYLNSQIIVEPESSESHLLLSDMIHEEIVELNLDVNDWESAIRESGKLLVQTQRISQGYIDEIIRITRMTSPYFVIAPHIAMPHTVPEKGAKSWSLGITSLKQPVRFGSKDNDPVKYIFFLSVLDNERHLNAMSILLELINSQRFFKVIDEATSPHEIIQYIKDFENANGNKLSVE